MNDIAIGATAISAAKMGTSDVSAIMLGTTQVWPPAAAVLHHALLSNTSGSTAATYTLGFTPASGNLLVAIGAGAVTWTTPSGWTLQNSQVNAGGAYVWTKTSNGTETTFTSTHNGSGGSAFPTYLEVWELPAGTTILGTGKYHITGSPDHLATVASLTGSYTFIVGGFYTTGTSSTSTITVDSAQMGVATQQSNGRLTGSSDGVVYASWRGDGQTGTPSPGGGFGAVSSSNSSGVGESIAIALRLP